MRGKFMEYNKDVIKVYESIIDEYMSKSKEELKKLSPVEKIFIYALYLNLKKVGKL